MSKALSKDNWHHFSGGEGANENDGAQGGAQALAWVETKITEQPKFSMMTGFILVTGCNPE